MYINSLTNCLFLAHSERSICSLKTVNNNNNNNTKYFVYYTNHPLTLNAVADLQGIGERDTIRKTTQTIYVYMKYSTMLCTSICFVSGLFFFWYYNVVVVVVFVDSYISVARIYTHVLYAFQKWNQRQYFFFILLVLLYHERNNSFERCNVPILYICELEFSL